MARNKLVCLVFFHPKSRVIDPIRTRYNLKVELLTPTVLDIKRICNHQKWRVTGVFGPNKRPERNGLSWSFLPLKMEVFWWFLFTPIKWRYEPIRNLRITSRVPLWFGDFSAVFSEELEPFKRSWGGSKGGGRLTSRYPHRKLTWQLKQSTFFWRCISYWRWRFSNVMLCFCVCGMFVFWLILFGCWFDFMGWKSTTKPYNSNMWISNNLVFIALLADFLGCVLFIVRDEEHHSSLWVVSRLHVEVMFRWTKLLVFSGKPLSGGGDCMFKVF